MALEAPNLDDRTFEEIFAEAKALIPRYAPEWTNHNESDPGIAMLQLFAWMTDMLLFRLNRVPERNYIKFLQMLGIELEPGRPSATELTFSLARDDIDAVIVAKGTLVAAAEPDDEGNNILFETSESLVALGAHLAAVQVYDGINYADKTNANLAVEQAFHPFGYYARPESALLLGFDSPIDFTAQQINLSFVLAEADKAEALICSLDLDSLPLPARLVWEFWDGQIWERLTVESDETQAFDREGHVYLKGPGSKAVKGSIGVVAAPLYWLRCRLEESYYQESPRLATVLTNTVRATQAETIRDEVLGGSNGRPEQQFFLAQPPVVALDRPAASLAADGSQYMPTYLQLHIQEQPPLPDDNGYRSWLEVDDFNASGADDPHFVLNRTTGEIRFGDGKQGRIPVANPANPNGNIVARIYRTGGGKRGNVGANTLTNLQTFVDQVDSVTNLLPAAGGSNEESVDEAQRRAVALLKSRNRAVTKEDFEYFAGSVPGVARAMALPLVHPRFEGAPIPGVVTIIIVPESDALPPIPNSRTLKAVCQCLTERRLLTSELYVVPPIYREIRVEVEVVAQPQADLATVRRDVENALNSFLHPLHGGDDGQGWPFGQTIFFSKVYQVVLTTSGVDRIQNNQLVLFLDGVAQQFCRDVPINEGELLVSGQHDIQVDYSR